MSVMLGLSAKGAPGVSLGMWGLWRCWPRAVLGLEADPAGGSWALSFGLTSDPGLMDLAAEQGPIGAEVLDRCSIEIGEERRVVCAPRDPVQVRDEAYGIDLEAEVVVVTDDVPHGVSAAQAAAHIQLVGLVNDVSLRNLIPAELAKGFGFLQSKPRSALSPVFVTPDELGDAWRGNKLPLPLLTHINGQWFGAPEAGEDMQFDFAQLVAHAAKTRPLSAGTLVGSGTVANQDTSRGASCFAEKRTVETLEHGKPLTPFMKFGDTVRIEMLDRAGRSIFGAIEQTVERYPS